MASDAKRQPDTPDGCGGLPPACLVAMRHGTCLESSRLLPGGCAALRVSGLCRKAASHTRRTSQ